MRLQNTDTAWNGMMLHCYAQTICCYPSTLVRDGVTLRCYVTCLYVPLGSKLTCNRIFQTHRMNRASMKMFGSKCCQMRTNTSNVVGELDSHKENMGLCSCAVDTIKSKINALAMFAAFVHLFLSSSLWLYKCNMDWRRV